MEPDKGNGTPMAQRKAIFRALVETQDKGVKVAESRQAVAEQFSISEDQVSKIEREGLEKEWPPL